MSSMVCGEVGATDVTHPKPGLTLAKSTNDALTVSDLCAPGVSVRATKYDERKATPTEWAQKAAVQADAAVNADFFDFPGWTYVVGRARGKGEDWPAGHQFKEARNYWAFGPNRAELEPNANVAPDPSPAITEIVGGHNLIIADGHSKGPDFDGDAVILTSHRRTAVGLSADRRYLYLFVSNDSLDGNGLASRMLQRASEAGFPDLDVATNMDGGGSSQMYVAGSGGLFTTGRQLNNHLGVLHKGTGEAVSCPYPAPKGYVDVAACDGIRGWAQSPASPDQAIDVHLYFDGVPGDDGVHSAAVHANVHRDDLCDAIGSCNHGFVANPPYSLYDGGEHAVHGYGINANAAGPNSELHSSPRTMQCTVEAKGVKRWITNPTVLASWGFVLFTDRAKVDDAVIESLPENAQVDAGPELARGDDESPAVYVIDQGFKRHIPSPAVAAAWHFDLGAAEKIPIATLDAMPSGPDVRARPLLVQGSGPKVFLVDDDVTVPPQGTGGADGGGVGGGASNGAAVSGAGGASTDTASDGDCGCSVAGATSSRALLVACGSLVGIALARRKRSRR